MYFFQCFVVDYSSPPCVVFVDVAHDTGGQKSGSSSELHSAGGVSGQDSMPTCANGGVNYGGDVG